MESSTKMPIQVAMPIRDIILKVNPAAYIKKKVAIREVGIAIMTAEAERQPRRKRYRTRPVVTRPSSKVRSVLFREFLTNVAWL